MAAILRRPRLAHCAILTLSLIAASCSLFRPTENPTDRQEHAARLRATASTRSCAAYADLALQLPAESDNYELLSAEQWVAAANIPRPSSAGAGFA